MASLLNLEKIGNVAEFKRGPFGSSIKKSVCVSKRSNTYKLYEQGNVINNDFERGKYYLTKEKFNELSIFEIKEGDILITCAGTLGKIVIVPKKFEKGIINSVLMRIRINNKVVNRKYFYYYFQSPLIQNNINKQSAGVAIKNLFSTKLLKEYELYLPLLSEQTLIVQEIEKHLTRLDEAIKNLKSVKEKLRVYRTAVLKAAFEGDENWEVKKLEEVCQKITDGAHFTPKYVNNGYPFITIKNRRNGKLDFVEAEKISKDDFLKLKHNDCNPKRGDVLFSKDGTVGEVIKIDYEKDFIVLSSWAILRPSDKISQDYLYWLMRSPNVFYQAIGLKTGTAIRRIVLRNLKLVKIKYPKSLQKQKKTVQEIESRFSVIDKVEEVVEHSLDKAEMLRKSILKSAFEGKLVSPVKQRL